MFRTFRKLFRPGCRVPSRAVARSPRAILLASGEQQRWLATSNEIISHKQLVSVDGETLLRRTLRQLADRWDTPPVVVTHHPAIADAVGNSAEVLELPPHRRRWIAETALASSTCWGDPTLILAGDVYWTDAALDVACSFNLGGPVRYLVTETTDGDDILGLWFRRRHRNRVASTLHHSVRHAQLGKNGKLWQAYRSLCGFSLVRHQLESIHAVRVEDASTDFDTLSDYQGFVKRRQSQAA